MAREKDSDVSGTSQSKRPTLNRNESSDQTSHQQHHRKHVVGGIGSRLHGRVPSSKALHKSHAATSTTKLSRRRSLSPDQADATRSPLAPGHRRATSDLKLTEDTPASSHIRKNSSHTSLKRNRSHVDVGKKTKSSTNLKRTLSNPAVQKLRSEGASKVHFNIGDDQDDFDPDEEDGQDDEWVDASTSASPLLSRRSSTATGAEPHTADGGARTTTGDPLDRTQPAAFSETQSLSQSPLQSGGRALTSHKQRTLTTRILQRTASHGAPPKMSLENVSALTGPLRQNTPDSGIGHDTPMLFDTPRIGNQTRPGSSGQELTSRFVGGSSQEPGSGLPVDSFLTAIPHGGISRAAVNGRVGINGPRRPKSTGNLSQARGRNHANVHGLQIAAAAAAAAAEDPPLTDEEDVDGGVLAVEPRARRNRSYMPSDMSRTQQKLNLQRASSSLETSHPHPAMGMGLGGVPVAAGPLVGGSSYDPRDPRLSKLLERTGTEYLVVRRYQNPVARSLTRLVQLPGMDKIRPIPRTGTGGTTRPSTAHSKRGSELGGGRPGPGLVMRSRSRDRENRDPSVATLIGGQSAARRPMTPRSTFASSKRITSHSVSSSMDTDDDLSRIHERQGLSGSSLVNGEDDAGTLALLRNMWDKNMDLSASQE